MSRNRDIPWPRILAEGTAIVVSILLAFGIQAWWDDRNSQVEQHKSLIAVLEEIQTNLAGAEAHLAYLEGTDQTIQQLFDASDGLTSISPVRLDELIVDVLVWEKVGFSTSAISSLADGGHIQTVSDDKLRASLTALESSYDWVRAAESQDEAHYRMSLAPFLAKNAFLPQIANRQKQKSYMPNPSPYKNDFAKGVEVDHSKLLGNSEFLGLLVIERWNLRDALGSFRAFHDDLSRTSLMIESYLVKQNP